MLRGWLFEGLGTDLNLFGLQESVQTQSRKATWLAKDSFVDQEENGGDSLLEHFHTTSLPLALDTFKTKFSEHFLFSYIATKCHSSSSNPSAIIHGLSI